MADTKVTVTEDLTAIKYFAQNNDKLLLSQLIFALPYVNDSSIRKILQLRSPMNLPKYDAEEGWRPLDENVNDPKGNQGAFSNRVITPKTAMKILSIRPQQFKQTFFADQIGPNAKDLPKSFAPYFWMQQNKRGATEITKKSFMGVDPDDISAWDSGTAYDVGDTVKFTLTAVLGEQFFECVTTTTAAESPTTHAAKWTNVDNKCLAKGWGTILKAEYSGLPGGQKVATGAHSSSNTHDHVKQMYRALPDELKDGSKWIAYMSIGTGEKYLDQVNDDYFKGVTVEEELKFNVRGTNKNCVVKPVAWMGSHPGIILTQAQNLTFGTDLAPDFSSLGKTVDDLHGYKTIQKATLAFQIADLEIVYLDNQGWS